jgi:hypothetical protein
MLQKDKIKDQSITNKKQRLKFYKKNKMPIFFKQLNGLSTKVRKAKFVGKYSLLPHDSF